MHTKTTLFSVNSSVAASNGIAANIVMSPSVTPRTVVRSTATSRDTSQRQRQYFATTTAFFFVVLSSSVFGGNTLCPLLGSVRAFPTQHRESIRTCSETSCEFADNEVIIYDELSRRAWRIPPARRWKHFSGRGRETNIDDRRQWGTAGAPSFREGDSVGERWRFNSLLTRPSVKNGQVVRANVLHDRLQQTFHLKLCRLGALTNCRVFLEHIVLRSRAHLSGYVTPFHRNLYRDRKRIEGTHRRGTCIHECVHAHACFAPSHPGLDRAELSSVDNGRIVSPPRQVGTVANILPEASSHPAG